MFCIQHKVHSYSDSGVGLNEEDEATVNKLINQLEVVGKQQVRAAVPATPEHHLITKSLDAMLYRNLIL